MIFHNSVNIFRYSLIQTIIFRFSLRCVAIDVDAVQGLGKKCSMIFLMISLALVTPSTTIFLTISSTFLASILILAAKSLVSLQTDSFNTSVHLKFFASSTSLALTFSMMTLASVIFSFTNCRMMASISSAFTFILLAMSLNSVHTLADSTSSHLTSSHSCPGKKCFLIFSMISLALVIPLAMISFITFMTSAYLIFKVAATSLILAQISAERASSHLKFFAISTSFSRTSLAISLALVIPFLTASRTILSTSAALIFNFSAAFFKAAQTCSERTSSHSISFATRSCPGQKWCLIFSMISLAFSYPLTTNCFMYVMTLVNLIFKVEAIFRNLLHAASERMFSHLILVASSTILARTTAMISLALVSPFLTASRTSLSTSAAFTFNFSATFFKALQMLAARTSSHVMEFSMSSCPGKKCFLISSMICLALVIPLAMISFMTFITSANLTFNSAATSRIFLQTSAERASSHLKLVAISMILARTILMISLALVIPFLTASRTILSTSAALTFNFSAASFKAL